MFICTDIQMYIYICIYMHAYIMQFNNDYRWFKVKGMSHMLSSHILSHTQSQPVIESSIPIQIVNLIPGSNIKFD
jgi:hypothetical protein